MQGSLTPRHLFAFLVLASLIGDAAGRTRQRVLWAQRLDASTLGSGIAGLQTADGAWRSGSSRLARGARPAADRTEAMHPDEELHEAVDYLEDRFNKSIHKLEHADNVKELSEKALIKTRNRFLPDFRLNVFNAINMLGTLISATLLLWLYMTFIYHDDRSSSPRRWQRQLDEQRAEADEDVAWQTFRPDVIVSFTNPAKTGLGYDASPTPWALRRVLANLDKNSARASSDSVVTTSSQTLESCNLKRLADRVVKLEAALEESQSFLAGSLAAALLFGGEPSTQNRQVHGDIMQDFYAFMPKLGFNVASFRSRTGEEIFLSISLQEHAAIEYFLERDSISLPLRPDIAKRLNIVQDPEDPTSSPPLFLYDERVLVSLAAAGVVDKDEREQMLSAFASSTQCLRVVHKEISLYFDLAAAKEERLLVDWFPAHNPLALEDLRASWGNWRAMLDLSYVQPVPRIGEYFGSRIAFLFAWNGTYCKMFFALSCIGLAHMLVIYVLNHFGIRIFTHRQLFAFSVLVVVWSRISWNLWAREEAFFQNLWNVSNNSKAAETRRLGYTGVESRNPLDLQRTEEREPPRLSFFRRSFSHTCTLLFCVVVMLTKLGWLLLFRGDMGPVSSAMLALLIKLFEFIFNYLAVFLTNFENHKHVQRHHDSFLWKMFCFQVVNNYSAFFFMTIFTVLDRKYISREKSLWELRVTLFFTFAILCLCSIAQFGFYVVLVKFNIWKNQRAFAARHPGEASPPLRPLEQQALYYEFEEIDEVQYMMTLIIALGYVFLFGAVSEHVVPLCLVLFTVQLRTFAIVLTHYARRVFPHEERGIGAWTRAIRMLMRVGIVYSGFLFVTYGELFEGTGILTHFTGLVLFYILMLGVELAVDVLFPRSDGGAKLLAKKRDYTLREFMMRSISPHSIAAESQLRIGQKEAVSEARWDDIPTLVSMGYSSMESLES